MQSVPDPQPGHGDQGEGERPSSDPDALEGLFASLYADLRLRAGRQMGGLGHHTLQPTALVNEAFVRLQRSGGAWNDRDHFLVAASLAMRHVLVDHHRSKTSSRRSGRFEPIEIETLASVFEESAHDLGALDDALSVLHRRDEKMSTVVQLLFFGGASMEEAARIVDIPKRTLERRWRVTKAWLHSQVHRGDE